MAPQPSVEALNESVEDDIYHVEFLLPASLGMHPELTQMIHDEVLAHAHVQGLMLVGEIMSVTHEEQQTVAAEAPVALVEGQPMAVQDISTETAERLASGLPEQMRADFIAGFNGAPIAPTMHVEVTRPVLRVVAEACVGVRL